MFGDNNGGMLSEIAEQMCRIEHKLDVLLTILAMSNPVPQSILTQVGDPNHTDPLNGERVEYMNSLRNGHVVRKTMSSTGIFSGPHLNFTVPIGDNNGGQQEE